MVGNVDTLAREIQNLVSVANSGDLTHRIVTAGKAGLRSEVVAQLVSIILVIMLGLAVSVEVYGLYNAGVDPLFSVILAIVIAAAAAIVNARIFGIGDRLRRFDAATAAQT